MSGYKDEKMIEINIFGNFSWRTILEKLSTIILLDNNKTHLLKKKNIKND